MLLDCYTVERGHLEEREHPKTEAELALERSKELAAEKVAELEARVNASVSELKKPQTP